jgi:Rrf2 family protein
MLEIALDYGSGPVKIKDIARRQGLSVKYLEQLIAILKSAGFVRSLRGAKGGYVLAKAPNKIKLSDIFKSLEGPEATVECLDNEEYCDRSADCVVRQVWAQLQGAIESVLSSVTLQDLIDRTKKDVELTYQI